MISYELAKYLASDVDMASALAKLTPAGTEPAIYPDALPQDAVFPCITLENERNPRPRQLYGKMAGMRTIRITANVYALTPADLRQADGRLIALTEDYSGPVAGITRARVTAEVVARLYDDDRKKVRSIVEIILKTRS